MGGLGFSIQGLGFGVQGLGFPQRFVEVQGWGMQKGMLGFV